MEIIDPEQLNECMTGEPEIDRDLMQCAMEEIGNRYIEMTKALANQDYEAWRINAHRSVGTAGTLGFKALSEEFRNAEHHSPTDTERKGVLEKIEALLAKTREALTERDLL